MHEKKFFDRRTFLSTAATTPAFVAGLGSSRLWALQSDSIGETAHFFYRLAPAGSYVDSHRDNRAFGFEDGKIFLSDDNCKNWTYSAMFPDAENITFSCLMKNGNIVFATRERLFLSTDKLATIQEIVVKNKDGSDYRPHTPKSADKPGWYFHSLEGVHTWDIDGSEMMVWGNYCNVDGGPVPANIYYSTDSGRTVKIAFSFGQNPDFQQANTDRVSFLGDPRNPVICRHIHSVMYNPVERAFYACTGDLDRGHGNECHWLRGVYDPQSDSWEWQVLVSVNANSRYKSGGIHHIRPGRNDPCPHAVRLHVLVLQWRQQFGPGNHQGEVVAQGSLPIPRCRQSSDHCSGRK